MGHCHVAVDRGQSGESAPGYRSSGSSLGWSPPMKAFKLFHQPRFRSQEFRLRLTPSTRSNFGPSPLVLKRPSVP
jgi:hypothetical protein